MTDLKCKVFVNKSLFGIERDIDVFLQGKDIEIVSVNQICDTVGTVTTTIIYK